MATKPEPRTRTYEVTTSDGALHTRKTETKHYTHAVVTAEGVVRWSESPDAAAKFARSKGGQGGTVVEVTLRQPREKVAGAERVARYQAAKAAAKAEPTTESLAEVLPMTKKAAPTKKAPAKKKAEPKPEPVTTMADKHTALVIERVTAYREEGLAWWPISEKLNEEGITTARGGAWHGTTLRSWWVKQGLPTAAPKKAESK